MGGGGVKVPTPKHFKYTDLDENSLHLTNQDDANEQARAADASYYDRSDRDYKARHPELVAANAQMEKDAAAEAGGAVPAAVQAQWAQAGLSGALTSGGDLTPGGQGAAGFAKNIGIDAMSYVNNARDRLSKITAANPQRSFGLSGADYLSVGLGNNAAKNQVVVGNNQGLNSANLSNVQADNTAALAQAQMDQQASNANKALIGSVIQGVGSAVGGMF